MKSSGIIALSIIGASVLVSLAVVVSARPGDAGGAHTGNSAPVEVPISPDDPVIGAADAPVTIVAFEDFECPFCGRFSRETFPRLRENEIKNGRVRVVWKDFPLSIHSHAFRAHEAARCAQAQGKFWEYHDVLFNHQNALNPDDFKRYANELGLDRGAFDSCFDSNKYRSLVQAGQREGFAAGVSGTPSFIINGTLVPGALPYESFAQIVAQIGS